MYDSYREHCDHVMGEASDQQNALAWSMMNRKPGDRVMIDAAIEAGKFVVVLDGPEYCPITDALMGSRVVLHATYATRAEALADPILKEDMDDVVAYVLPRAVPTVRATQEGWDAIEADDDSDLPF